MKKLGIRIENIENTKTKFVQLPKETMDKLNKQSGKTPHDYIKRYLNNKKLHDKIWNQYTEYVNKTLPKDVKQSCQYCNGDSKNVEDKKCSIYYSEAQINYFFASHEFVSIVEKNKNLIKGNELKRKLTIQFHECFLFQDGRVFFDLEKMAMYCLKAGFFTLSKIFANNSALQNLSIINNTIDELNTEELNAEMFNKEKSIYLEPQKRFFEDKYNHFQRKQFIDSESKKLNENSECEPQQDSQFSVLEWATIFYYADETKLLPENRFLKSRIEKFIEFHKIPTTFKSFKSKYHTTKNRINKNNNYPIDKLELILPFLEKNYKQAVTLIDRDINFLLSEKSEYQ